MYDYDRRIYVNLLTEAQRKAAEEAGRREAARQEQERVRKNANLANKYGFAVAEDTENGKNGKMGVLFSSVTEDLTNKAMTQLKLIDAFAKKNGLLVRVYDTLGKQNAQYHEGTNMIDMALDADDGALTRVVSHEAFHYIENWNKDAAQKLRDFVLDRLKQNAEYDLEQRVQDFEEKYKLAQDEKGRESALSEIAADSMLDMIGTEENLKALVNTDKGLTQKIIEWAKKTAKQLHDLIDRFAGRSAEARALTKDAEYLEKIGEMFEEALKQAKENMKLAGKDLFSGAKENEAINSYVQNMEHAASKADREQSVNVMLSSLFYQTQGELIRKGIQEGADIDALYTKFKDALLRYARKEVSLKKAFEDAGLLTPDKHNMALSYAGRQLMEAMNRGMEGERYSLKEGWYDYSKSFAEQVEDYEQGNFNENDTLIMGKTPSIFERIGLSSLPMVIDQKHVDYAINGTKNNNHYLGKEMLKKIPELLKKPVAIIESATKGDTSVVAIVKGLVNGNQVMAAVKITGNGLQNGEQIDANVVTSVYGRENIITKLLTDAINKENTSANSVGVYYINKFEARSLYARPGVQFPGTALKDGLIHSVYDVGAKVNRKYFDQTKTRQFERWFKESKVVDEDGNPLIVYHGTDAEFNTFDMTKGRANMDIQGAFFSPYEIDAEGYGGNVKAFYLSIKNPANEGTAYKALNMFKGQNNAGIKAREYLIKQGYDGVYNGVDEYIAFYPNQIKSATDNIGLFDNNNADTLYSMKDNADKADTELTDMEEWREVFNEDGSADFFVEEMEQAQAAASIFNRMHELSEEMRGTGFWGEKVLDSAKRILKDSGSEYNTLALKNRMARLFEALDDKQYSAKEILQFARELAGEVLAKTETTAEDMESAKTKMALDMVLEYYNMQENLSGKNETALKEAKEKI